MPWPAFYHQLWDLSPLPIQPASRLLCIGITQLPITLGSCLWKKLLKPLIDYFFVKILLYFSYFAHVVRFNICSILFVHLIMVLITHFVVICLHYQTRKPWKWWCIFFLQDFILSWHMKNSGKHFLDAKITLFNFKLCDALMD